MVSCTPPPARLVDDDNHVAFGVFDGPVRDINLDRARIRSHGFRLSRPLSRMRLKEWQHFAVVLPDLFLSFAIVDAKFLRTTWCHVVDRVTGEHFEQSRQSPVLNMRIARELFDDTTSVAARGYRITVDNGLDRGEHRVLIEVDERPVLPSVRAELRCLHAESVQPLVVVLPVGRGRGMYSHKVPLPVEGHIEVGGRRYEARPDQAVAILDIHKAHYPRRTFWNWATCAGWDAQGRLIGLNLTRNVNRDDARFNENAIWIDGRVDHLGPAVFELDRVRVLEPWRLTTTDGAVDLRFEPEGERSESIRTGVISSVFHQPYGTFHGTVKTGGETVAIDGLYGVCEDHRAVW